MLKKEICFKCHMRNYGVDGTNCSNVKCYPPPNKNDRKQCEDIFMKEWENNKVWCFGINNEATDEELKEILGEERWNIPFISINSDPPKFCYYKKEQNGEFNIV